MLHFKKTFLRVHLVQSSEWFCFSPVAAASQSVGAKLEVLGVLRQVFHMFRFIAERCTESKFFFFLRNKEKSDKSLCLLMNLFYFVEKKQFETNIF